MSLVLICGLKSGYHHVEIYPSHQRFLGFSLVFQRGSKIFKFIVLPFGLSTGPCIFTKVMRPLVKHWRIVKPSAL